jgi:hypothetical protein
VDPLSDLENHVPVQYVVQTVLNYLKSKLNIVECHM